MWGLILNGQFSLLSPLDRCPNTDRVIFTELRVITRNYKHIEKTGLRFLDHTIAIHSPATAISTKLVPLPSKAVGRLLLNCNPRHNSLICSCFKPCQISVRLSRLTAYALIRERLGLIERFECVSARLPPLHSRRLTRPVFSGLAAL